MRGGKSLELCNNWWRNHHISLCDSPSRPVNNAFEVRPDANSISISRSNLHVDAGGRIALQTACAAVRGEGGPRKDRVLFDAGSHRSFERITCGVSRKGAPSGANQMTLLP